MKPISKAAYSEILESYLDQMHGRMPDRCSSSTCSAVALVCNDAVPEEDNDDFYDELVSIYEWTSTEEGLNDYLKNRFEEQLDYEGSADSAFFYIGNSEESQYESFEDFMEDLDVPIVLQTLKKCWERACKEGVPFPETQFIDDYWSIDRSKY